MLQLDQSILGYFVHAGWVVKVVMLLLVATSVLSWTFIFQRRQVIDLSKKTMAAFEEKFWSGQPLSQLYSELDNLESSGMPVIFKAGFREYLRLREQAQITKQELLEAVSGAMQIARNKELDKLEENLSFLATTASVSPYVGLFGTVWGIMSVLQALGNVSQATVAAVAPGISEALIATALGLFVAIPAAIAYNNYSNSVNHLDAYFSMFVDEFCGLLRRQVFHGEKS